MAKPIIGTDDPFITLTELSSQSGRRAAMPAPRPRYLDLKLICIDNAAKGPNHDLGPMKNSPEKILKRVNETTGAGPKPAEPNPPNTRTFDSERKRPGGKPRLSIEYHLKF